MIDIEYNKLFLIDLKKLKGTSSYQKIKEFCFEMIYDYKSINEIPGIKKIVGFNHYFRKRMGDYRIGIKYLDHKLIFMRVLNRRDIYKKFP